MSRRISLALLAVDPDIGAPWTLRPARVNTVRQVGERGDDRARREGQSGDLERVTSRGMCPPCHPPSAELLVCAAAAAVRHIAVQVRATHQFEGKWRCKLGVPQAGEGGVP